MKNKPQKKLSEQVQNTIRKIALQKGWPLYLRYVSMNILLSQAPDLLVTPATLCIYQ